MRNHCFAYCNKYFVTARMALRGKTNGGMVYLIPQIVIRILYLIPLMFLWRNLADNGYQIEMDLPQLLSYTYVNALLAEQFAVRTFITDWDFDVKGTSFYTRPMPVFGFVLSRTAGEWLPSLLFFSIPMALVAPAFGIAILPKTLWVLPSLLLCVSLGFAFEFIFFCITLRLHHVSWLTLVIRDAAVSLFSGMVIPFAILPFGLNKWIGYQPFGSLGGAVLSLYVGGAEPAAIIPPQIFWNIVIWLAAAVWFRRSRERMVSYGG